MRKPIHVHEESVCMSSTELYQRLLSIACTQGPPDATIFAHELAAVAPSLFQDDGSMRKGQKSQLATYIMKMDPDITVHEPTTDGAKVYDGCALIHRLRWPKVGTMYFLCEAYAFAVVNDRNDNEPIAVVFDSYDVVTTKDHEQKR